MRTPRAVARVDLGTHTPADKPVVRRCQFRCPDGDARGAILQGNATVATNGSSGPKAVNRREMFLFAAVLAATALTGAAAIAGLHRAVPAAPSAPQIGQTITPQAPAPREPVEPGG